MVVRYERPLRPDELMHYGVKGMKWGIRRYQNYDGTWKNAGKERHSKQQAKLAAGGSSKSDTNGSKDTRTPLRKQIDAQAEKEAASRKAYNDYYHEQEKKAKERGEEYDGWNDPEAKKLSDKWINDLYKLRDLKGKRISNSDFKKFSEQYSKLEDVEFIKSLSEKDQKDYDKELSTKYKDTVELYDKLNAVKKKSEDAIKNDPTIQKLSEAAHKPGAYGSEEWFKWRDAIWDKKQEFAKEYTDTIIDNSPSLKHLGNNKDAKDWANDWLDFSGTADDYASIWDPDTNQRDYGLEDKLDNWKRK